MNSLEVRRRLDFETFHGDFIACILGHVLRMWAELRWRNCCLSTNVLSLSTDHSPGSCLDNNSWQRTLVYVEERLRHFRSHRNVSS